MATADHDMGDLEKNIGTRAEGDDSSSDTSTLLNKPEGETADSSKDSIALPAEEASPGQIRTWITEVLTTNHQVDIYEARDIASKWTIGTGHELRKFTPCIYRDIFGSAAAWILYKEAKVAAAQEDVKKSPPMSWPSRIGITTTIIVFEVLLSVVLTHFIDMAMLAIMVPLYLIGFCACMAVLCDGADKLGGDKKAVERIENELIKYWGINGNGTKSTG